MDFFKQDGQKRIDNVDPKSLGSTISFTEWPYNYLITHPDDIDWTERAAQVGAVEAVKAMYGTTFDLADVKDILRKPLGSPERTSVIFTKRQAIEKEYEDFCKLARHAPAAAARFVEVAMDFEQRLGNDVDLVELQNAAELYQQSAAVTQGNITPGMVLQRETIDIFMQKAQRLGIDTGNPAFKALCAEFGQRAAGNGIELAKEEALPDTCDQEAYQRYCDNQSKNIDMFMQKAQLLGIDTGSADFRALCAEFGQYAAGDGIAGQSALPDTYQRPAIFETPIFEREYGK